MDELKTRAWLDARYREVDECGVYFAHQPIYGLTAGHCEPGLFDRYGRTYQIMRALARLDFRTLLDVGGSEGYKSYLAKELLGVTVKNSDLSFEACKRAQEVFGVESIPAHIHALPFADRQFDVVLSSETLEHVPDLDRAVRELLRVAAKAVVITVPHEPSEEVDKHRHEMHAHIHALGLDTFDYLQAEGVRVAARKLLSERAIRLAGQTFEREIFPVNLELAPLPKRALLRVYNTAVVPLLNRWFRKFAASAVLRLDDRVSTGTDTYYAMLFVLLKDPHCLRRTGIRRVSPYRLVNFKRPLHYLPIAERERPSLRADQNTERPVPATETQKRLFASGTTNVTLHLDRVTSVGGAFVIAGWAHVEAKDAVAAETWIVLQSVDCTYVCPTVHRARPDVTAAFPGLDLDRSGFRLQISTMELKRGRYRVGVYIERGDDKAFRFTDKVLTVE